MNKKNVYTLIVTMFFISAAYTMLIPFLPLYLMELGVTGPDLHFWTGLIFSVCFLVAGLMGPIWGKLADTKGKKRMVIRASLLIGLSYVLCGLVQNEWQLLWARAFQGFANGFVAAALAIISQSTDEKRIGMTLGLAQTALVVGGICGPLIGGAVSHLFGMRASFFIGGAVLWAISLAVWLFVREKKAGTAAGADTSIMEDLRFAWGEPHLKELLIFFFLFQSALLMIQPVTSLYIGELQGTMENVDLISGVILSCGGIAGALTTAMWGKIGQKKGYYWAMAVTFSCAGALLMVQSLPRSVWGFGLCQFLVGCFLIGTTPSINAAFVKYTDENFRGRVFGLANTSQQFGNMAGPLLSAGITLYFSMASVYFLAGVSQLLVGLYVWRRHVRRGER